MQLVQAELPWWKKEWDKNPLKMVMVIAVLIRLLAAVFSKGYAFHDDHFDVIRVAQDWVDGFPHWIGDENPPNHSMFYAGINAAIIYLLEAIGITDTQLKVFFVRLIHAFYSLLTVYYGFKITELLSGKKTAIMVGCILSLLWFMPQLGVKNLAELVCVPPVLAGYYLIIKYNTVRSWLIAGLLFGLAFTFRLHVVLFAGGTGMVLLYKKQWKEAASFTFAYLAVSFLIVGVIDLMFWEYPFQSIIGYFSHNAGNAYGYITGPPYKFLLTLLGFTVPPISIMFLFGFFKTWKIEPYMFWGGLMFFFIHSVFPNKQERFILPFIPIFIILGACGWHQIIAKSSFWTSRVKLYKGLWIFFWVINVIAAVGLSLSYSKKDRIAPLYYLSKLDDVESVVVQSENSLKLLPVYYFGSMSSQSIEYHKKFDGYMDQEISKAYLKDEYVMFYHKDKNNTIEDMKSEMDTYGKVPNYVILKGAKNLAERTAFFEEMFSKKMQLKEVIQPDFFDLILHFLNPRVHKDEAAHIYKLE